MKVYYNRQSFQVISKLKLSTQLLICLLPIAFSHPTDFRHLTITTRSTSVPRFG